MPQGPQPADLPIAQRLALSYATARYRAEWAGFFALDARLAALVRAAREPMVAQIRLAWWREQVSGLGSTARTDEPLLGELAELGGKAVALVHLVDGWEAMLLEDTEVGAGAKLLTDARARTIVELFDAQMLEHAIRSAATAWTLGEYRTPEPKPELQAGFTLPRHLRPVQMLGRLGQRAIVGQRAELLASPLDLLLAMRIGLIGR